MLTGRSLGHGTATTTDGLVVPYTLVEPEKTTANLSAMAGEAQRWRQTVEAFRRLVIDHQLPMEVARRAQFGEEVLATAAENIRVGACCVAVAQAYDGRILGVVVYAPIPPHEGALNLLAVDPENMSGSPHATQTRGVGTALVAVAGKQLVARGAQTIFLHPLDVAAMRFWEKRGFGSCGAGGLMCVRGPQAVAALIDGCFQFPESPVDGEYVGCGSLARTAGMRLPHLR